MALHDGAGASPRWTVGHGYSHKLDFTLGFEALWTESFSDRLLQTAPGSEERSSAAAI